MVVPPAAINFLARIAEFKTTVVPLSTSNVAPGIRNAPVNVPLAPP